MPDGFSLMISFVIKKTSCPLFFNAIAKDCKWVPMPKFVVACSDIKQIFIFESHGRIFRLDDDHFLFISILAIIFENERLYLNLNQLVNGAGLVKSDRLLFPM